MRHFYLIPILLVLICNARLSAQNDSYKFDHLTVDDGLSQSTVFSITKDAHGFLWFGTRDGLNRYDSRTIKTYKHKDADPGSVSGNNIHCFLNDHNGRLWIGTNEGISIYQPETDNFLQIHPDPAMPNSLSGSHVSTLAEDHEGTIWVGTNIGLNKLTGNTERTSFERFNHDPNNSGSLLDDDIRDLLVDSRGNLWIATSLGISRMVKNGGQIYFINYPLAAETVQSRSWINCLREDGNGNILIGTEQNGLNILTIATGKIRNLNLGRTTNRIVESVRVIEKDGDMFWVGTIDGLYILDQHLEVVSMIRNVPEDNTSINDNSVRSIYIDPAGLYWIGTFYGGINLYSPLSRQFGQVRLMDKNNQKPSKIAGAITSDPQGNLWISTDGNGLYCLNAKGETLYQFKHQENDPNTLSHNKIKCLLLEREGIWIGTLKGLNYYNFRTKRFTHYFHDPNDPSSLGDDRIYDIKKDSKGNLWIATYRGGLCRFLPGTHTFQRIIHDDNDPSSLSSNGITYLYEDHNKNLWVGTVSGLNKMSTDGRTFLKYGNHWGSLEGEGDYILCITQDASGTFWIGTRDAGLMKLTADRGTITLYNTDNGLPGNNVNGILEDASRMLWLSTENGLSRFDPRTLHFRNYSKDDGLVCKEFNFNSFHKDSKGIMYFGGYNGIVRFNPDRIIENKAIPPVQFTRLRIFNKEVPIGQDESSVLRKSLMNTSALSFNYQQNVFTIEFAALSFVNSSKNQYAYRLEGFEDDWNYVTEPYATYMNLSPGDYTLMVKASNNDGIWTEHPVTIGIHVLPPPWKTWWAYCLYVAVILGLVYMLIRFNKVRWKLAHDLHIEHLEKEQQEKLHKAKLAFFTNIAHEIRTPLTLIVSPLEIALRNYVLESSLQKHLNLVKTNTTRLMRLINQLLDFQKQESGTLRLKPSRGNLVELVKEIVYSFTEHARTRNITLSLKAEPENIPVRFDQNELEKVFCNLLHNAFKFTPGGGTIRISIAREGKEAKIVVEDNGIGIPADDIPKIFNRFFQVENKGINESGFGIGLALTKGIIDLHGGTIDVESHEADLGHSGFTRFTIAMPLCEASVPEGTSYEQVAMFTEDPVYEEPESDAPSQKTAPDKPTVLLVEDNGEIRQCLRTLLGTDYNILEASQGEEAWQQTVSHLPDLVISDIAMPVMDGISFVKLMKSDHRTDHIPVILLTARGAIEHHVEGIEMGADDYITKPFNSQILQLKIRNLLAARERLREKYQKIVALQPQVEELEDPQEKFMARLMNILERYLHEPEFSVTMLAREIGMSRPVLFRKVKVLTGLSIIDLIRTTRLKKAELLLRQKKMSVSEVAFAVGFNDPKHFSKSFRTQYGKTPTEYMGSVGY